MVLWVCDGCGKHQLGVTYKDGAPGWHKPQEWFSKQDPEKGPLEACSRKCIETVAQKTGTSSAVLPI